jgi:hypothetical protein
MGLDISLYSKSQQEASDAYWTAWQAIYDRCEKGEITEEQRKAEEAALDDGRTPYSDRGIPSMQFPEHHCNRTYLRSSYNSGGFNNAASELLDDPAFDGFYTIFAPVAKINGESKDHDSMLNGEWGWVDARHIDALKEAAKIARAAAEKIRSTTPYRVASESAVPHLGAADHMWSTPPSSDQALAWFREEQKKFDERDPNNVFGDSGYSTAKGTHFGKGGLTVLGVVPGIGILGEPCLHMILAPSDEDREYYAQVADIAAEFAMQAIEFIEADGAAYISWSG